MLSRLIDTVGCFTPQQLLRANITYHSYRKDCYYYNQDKM